MTQTLIPAAALAGRCAAKRYSSQGDTKVLRHLSPFSPHHSTKRNIPSRTWEKAAAETTRERRTATFIVCMYYKWFCQQAFLQV